MTPEAALSFHSLAGSGLAVGLALMTSCVRTTAPDQAGPDEDQAAIEAAFRSAPRAPLEQRTPEDRLLSFGAGGKQGLIDTHGRIVVEPEFAWTTSSAEGRAGVASRGLWGFVDGTGRLVIEQKWDDASPFSEGLAVVASGVEKSFNRELGLTIEKGGKRGYIDRDGNVVIAPQFTEARPFSEGVAWVSAGEKWKNEKWGLIDRTGKYVVEPRYQFGSVEPGRFSQGLCPVWQGGGWDVDESVERFAYIDTTGATVIPARFRGAGSFSEGLAPIVTGGKLGFIDRAGEMSIPPQFDWGSVNLNSLLELPTFSEGLAAVRIEGRHGFIDKSGRVAIEPHYESALGFSDGLAAVTLQGKTGFIDKEGRMVIAPQFNRVNSFADGIARVEVNFGDVRSGRRTSAWGYIRRDGTFLWHPLQPLDEGSSLVPAGK